MTGAAVPRASTFPEGAAERQGLRAGVVTRVGAMVVDVLVVAALLAAAYLGFAGLRLLRDARAFTWPQPEVLEVAAVAEVVAVLMLTTAWASTGRTRGMRLMGLRLVGRSGGRVGPVKAFLRAVACVAFPLGLFWSAVSKRNASLQDLLFRTSVIYDWSMQVPAARGDEPGQSEPATTGSTAA